MKLFFSGNIPALPSGLSVAVYEHDGTDTPATLATITDRAGSPITQPGFVTDADGRFEFSGADGLYDVKLGGGAGAPDTSWNGGAALWIRGQSLSDPGVAAGENKLINGCLRINQRAVAGTVVLAAGDYGHDRWRGGVGGCTYTFATVANVTTITITAGTLEQEIEGLNLRSGTHVLSWGGTAQGQIDAGGYGTSGNVTATLTGGTNATVEFGIGTLYDVQLEEGDTVTSFEQRSMGQELVLCQRYYEKSYEIADAPGTVTAAGSMGATLVTPSLPAHMFPYRVEKRSNPTVVFYSAATGVATVVRNFNTSLDVLANLSGYSSTKHLGFWVSSQAAGQTMEGHWTADAEL